MSYFSNETARVEHLEHVAYYESCQIGLGARYLLAFDAAMGSRRIVTASSSRLLFVSTAYQVFPTTSSIELWIQTLKFWSLQRIGGGLAIGWVGFNWSPKSYACGAS